MFEKIQALSEEIGYFVDNHPENSEYHFVMRSGDPVNKMERRVRTQLEKEFEFDKMGTDIRILFEQGRKRKKAKMTIKEKELEDED